MPTPSGPEDLPLWERERHWPLMRPFVYYLVENFVPPAWIPGRRVVDFSAGMGDLAAYMAANDPASLTVTVPDTDLPKPASLPASARWRTGVLASHIADGFPEGSVDLFCARMVFQFPRWEDGEVDPDVMLRQIIRVLAPGGRLVIATHAFFSLQTYPSLESEADSDALLMRLTDLAAGAPRDIHEILTTEAQRIAGRTEMVRYLNLPPRLGTSGMTGYGLKIPMLVDSFIQAGFQLEVVEEAEPFTYPLGIWTILDEDPEWVHTLGREVFATKRRHLTGPEAAAKYRRPHLIKRLLQEVRWLVPIVWVPIVRIAATRPR
jgi:SAM-dependent methyltransferase